MKLIILFAIHLSDLGAAEPDRLESLYAYDTLAECWTAAEAMQDEPGETVFACVAEQ